MQSSQELERALSQFDDKSKVTRPMNHTMQIERKVLLLVALLHGLAASARMIRYEEMKQALGEQSLPLVNVTVDTALLSRTDFTAGEIEIADPLCRTVPGERVVRYRCKYRIRGGTAADYRKKSFAVKLVDGKGDDLDAPVFGIREENSWILDAMAVDRTRMRNRVCFDVWNGLSRTPYATKYDGRNGTQGVFAEVFVNGSYNGLYCMTDKIDRKLLGLKKAKAAGDGITVRGLLYKGDAWGSSSDLRSYEEDATDKDSWNAWELQYPADYPSAAAWQPLMDLIDFCSAETPGETFRAGYGDYFHTGNLLDYVVFTLALHVGDNAYKNTFLSTPDVTQSHCWLLTPWDMDMSLGGFYDGSYDETLATLGRYNHIAPFNRLYVEDIDGFRAALTARWTEHYQTLLSPEEVIARMEAYAGAFIASGAWQRERERWDGAPVPLKASPLEEIQYVRDWYWRNFLSLCGQFGTDTATMHVHGAGEAASRGGTYTLGGRKAGNRPVRGIYVAGGRKTAAGARK